MYAALYAFEGSFTALMDIAHEFSPRVEVCNVEGGEVTLDVIGLTRLVGDGRTIAMELRRTAAERGVRAQVAVAGTCTAARILAHYAARAIKARATLPEVVVIEPGTEREALASLPIDLLSIFETPHSQLPTPGSRLPVLHQWGLRTLGDLAALPPAEVAARLGQAGVEWQRVARGEDGRPLVPAVPEERFEQALDLEWPIEGLEPLAFVLGRLLEPLAAHLERRDRGAAVLHVRLHLVTREVHERSLQLPAPIRDARTLRTLALLDLESHPPSAAIDRVVVAVDPTPGRVVQFSLLTRPLPSPEQLSTLMARLHALMGEGRCGAAVAVDSWEPGAFAMQQFSPQNLEPPDPRSRIPDPGSPIPVMALRRFRHPMPVRVRVEHGVPVRVIADRHGWSGGHVETSAGPWRSSGGWWIETDDKGRGARVRKVRGCEGAWERDEWDVSLSDGATYRIFRDRGSEAWFIEGVVD